MARSGRQSIPGRPLDAAVVQLASLEARGGGRAGLRGGAGQIGAACGGREVRPAGAAGQAERSDGGGSRSRDVASA